MVRLRSLEGNEVERELAAADPAMLSSVRPWRSFPSRRGQRHYPGLYWCAATGAHVAYESRLELARLILADFDPGTVAIAAQPFLLEQATGGRVRRHVPDFLLVNRDGLATVVNVKPVDRLARPEVAETFAWAATAFRARGWGWEVWSGCDGVTMADVRFLAGYRRSWLIDPETLQTARSTMVAGATIGTLVRLLASTVDAAVVRPAVLHLLWRGEFTTDLAVPLAADSKLIRSA